jgi:hypothetical protein
MTLKELCAAIARPDALDRIKDHLAYFQSVGNSIKEFRTSYAAAYDLKDVHPRSSRRQVSTELDSALHMLSRTHPVPEQGTLQDPNFRKTKWNSRARLQAVAIGIEISGAMLLSVIEEHGSTPLFH